jgi:hypothetical protein
MESSQNNQNAEKINQLQEKVQEMILFRS